MIAKTEITNQNQVTVAGISVRTTNKDGQSAQDIGGLWTWFMNGNLLTQIHGRLADDIYCVYSDYESDHTAPYTATLGCAVDSPDDLPDGFTGVTIPAGKYKIHHLSGEFPANIGEAWQEIWASNIDRKYTADYDFYKAGAKSFEETEAMIYLAVG